MLQLLVCADIHSFTDNLSIAMKMSDRVDAVLIAGDIEAEEDVLTQALRGVPCYAVCGNNDYCLNTDYPRELLLDVSVSPCADGLRTGGTSHVPAVTKVTELSFSSLPPRYAFLPSMIRNYMPVSLLSSIGSGMRPPGITHRILLTHGDRYNVPDTGLLSRRAAMWGADIVIYGHTHRFDLTKTKQGLLFLNPGTLVGTPEKDARVLAEYELCSFAFLRISPQGEVDVRHMHVLN